MVLWLVVYNLLVALVEETFARGVLLVALVTAFADRRHGTLIAVILSSAVFGLGHVPGMLGYPWWLVAAKVLWATALGVFLAAVYLRSGNLWSTVILHALLNIAAGAAVFLSPQAEPFSTAGVTLLVCVGLGVFGLFLLRRRDPAAVR